MAEHKRIKVSYKGNVFVVKNYLDFTQKTRDLYEKETDIGVQNSVIISLFQMTLSTFQELIFSPLSSRAKLSLAKAWHQTSIGVIQKEEPNIVY
jgi:hypothetical protein